MYVKQKKYLDYIQEAKKNYGEKIVGQVVIMPIALVNLRMNKEKNYKISGKQKLNIQKFIQVN